MVLIILLTFLMVLIILLTFLQLLTLLFAYRNARPKFVISGCFINRNGVQYVKNVNFVFCYHCCQCSTFNVQEENYSDSDSEVASTPVKREHDKEMKAKEDTGAGTSIPATKAMVDMSLGGKGQIVLSGQKAQKEPERTLHPRQAPNLTNGDNVDQGKTYGAGVSFWDLALNRAYNLLEADLGELNKYNAVNQSRGLENCVSKATTLAYMSELRAKPSHELQRLKAENAELKNACCKANEILSKAKAEVQSKKEARNVEHVAALRS